MTHRFGWSLGPPRSARWSPRELSVGLLLATTMVFTGALVAGPARAAEMTSQPHRGDTVTFQLNDPAFFTPCEVLWDGATQLADTCTDGPDEDEVQVSFAVPADALIGSHQVGLCSDDDCSNPTPESVTVFVTVPAVVGDSYRDAQAALSAVGLTGVLPKRTVVSTQVASQAPAAGDVVSDPKIALGLALVAPAVTVPSTPTGTPAPTGTSAPTGTPTSSTASPSVTSTPTSGVVPPIPPQRPGGGAGGPTAPVSAVPVSTRHSSSAPVGALVLVVVVAAAVCAFVAAQLGRRKRLGTRGTQAAAVPRVCARDHHDQISVRPARSSSLSGVQLRMTRRTARFQIQEFR
jgi:hypothetical protein